MKGMRVAGADLSDTRLETIQSYGSGQDRGRRLPGCVRRIHPMIHTRNASRIFGL
jgi:hypothetical protein